MMTGADSREVVEGEQIAVLPYGRQVMDVERPLALPAQQAPDRAATTVAKDGALARPWPVTGGVRLGGHL